MALIDKEWFARHLTKVTATAGPKYHPELNVDLPISKIFDGISRTKQFYRNC